MHVIFVFVDAYNNTRYNYLYSLSTSPFWPYGHLCVSKKTLAMHCEIEIGKEASEIRAFGIFESPYSSQNPMITF